MRGWALLVLVTLAAAAATPVAQAAICSIGGAGGVQYPCDGGSGSAPSADDTPWYATGTAQFLLALVGLVGSAGAGLYTYTRVRRRRKTLAMTISRIDDAQAYGRSDPLEGAALLATIRGELKRQHEKGRLEDGQYLELDKRVREGIVRLRVLAIQRSAPDLPPDFLQHVRHLLDDGQVSAQDVAEIDRYAHAYQLSLASRETVARMVGAWARADETTAPVQVA
jgi:hypothetical protein